MDQVKFLKDSLVKKFRNVLKVFPADLLSFTEESRSLKAIEVLLIYAVLAGSC